MSLSWAGKTDLGKAKELFKVTNKNGRREIQIQVYLILEPMFLTAMPYHTPHWATMVFHTGFCQSPLAVKCKMLKLDVISMGTEAFQRLISSLNSWTSVLVGQPQELPDTGWNQAQGSSGWISTGTEKHLQTGAAWCLILWALAKRRPSLLITLKQ